MTQSVELNIDLGELDDEPEELYQLATVVNIACGGHAGNRFSIRKALALSKSCRATLAAHPSYPDREGFGRRRIELPLDRLTESLIAQLSIMAELAGEADIIVQWIKPHGALYHAVSTDDELAGALVELSTRCMGEQVGFVGVDRGALCNAARSSGRPFAREGFADRGYDEFGTLLSRDREGALIDDPQLAGLQAERLARTGAIDTLCVHGDGSSAVVVARAVRESLERGGWLVRPQP